MDRDAPKGKPIWNLKVKVNDGQAKWPNIKDQHKTSVSQSLSPVAKREVSPLRHLGHLFSFKWNGISNKSIWHRADEKGNLVLPSFGSSRVSHLRAQQILRSLRRSKFFELRQKKIGKRSANIFSHRKGASDLLTNFVKKRPAPFHARLNIARQLYRLCKYNFKNNTAMSASLLQPKTLQTQIKIIKPTKISHLERIECTKQLYKKISAKKQRIKKRLRVSRDTEQEFLTNDTKIASFLSMGDGRQEYNFDEDKCIRFDPHNPIFDADNVAQIHHLKSKEMLQRAIGLIHETEINVYIVVKDVNDNAPFFLNQTMYGEVQENGPISEYYLILLFSNIR